MVPKGPCPSHNEKCVQSVSKGLKCSSIAQKSRSKVSSETLEKLLAVGPYKSQKELTYFLDTLALQKYSYFKWKE
jgi:hypothetical protein